VSVVHLAAPLDRSALDALKAGDAVLISGEIYTARDAAHERLVKLAAEKKPWPFNTSGALVYYAGPSPAPPGLPIGSVGPTSSYRMASFLDAVLSAGILATMGKGDFPEAARAVFLKHRAVYLSTIGGAGALLAGKVLSSDVIAFDDLGPEAIRRLAVRDFPAVVVYDVHGGDVFSEAARYRK